MPEENRQEARGGLRSLLSVAAEKIERILSPAVSFLSSSSRLLSAVILSSVAALLLLLSFAPVVYTEAEIDGETYRADYNNTNIAEVGILSLFSYDELSISDTEYYERLSEFEEKLDSGKVSMDDKGAVSEALKNLLFTELMKYGTPVRTFALIATVILGIYFILSAVLLISSVKVLILELIAKLKGTVRDELPIKKCVRLLWTNLALLPLVAYASTEALTVAPGASLSVMVGGVGMSWGFVLTVIASALGSLFFVMKYTVAAIGNASQARNGQSGLISLLLSIAILICAALPLITVDVSFERWGRVRETNVNIGASDVTEIGAETVRYYANLSFVKNVEFIADALEEGGFDGIKKLGAVDILYRSVIGCARFNPGVISVVSVLVVMAVLLFAAIMIRRMAAEVLLGFNVKGGKKSKVILLLLSLALAGIILYTCILANEAFLGTDKLGAVFNLGAGPIAMIILSVGILITSKKTAVAEKIEGGYDNADISHAPYVVR